MRTGKCLKFVMNALKPLLATEQEINKTNTTAEIVRVLALYSLAESRDMCWL